MAVTAKANTNGVLSIVLKIFWLFIIILVTMAFFFPLANFKSIFRGSKQEVTKKIKCCDFEIKVLGRIVFTAQEIFY